MSRGPSAIMSKGVSRALAAKVKLAELEKAVAAAAKESEKAATAFQKALDKYNAQLAKVDGGANAPGNA